MIGRIVVEEGRESDASWGCELVQRLERQYPTVWDGVISDFLKTSPSGSLTRILGLTSITSQVQVFEKLNHVESSIRVEAIKWIADNTNVVKVRHFKTLLFDRVYKKKLSFLILDKIR